MSKSRGKDKFKFAPKPKAKPTAGQGGMLGSLIGNGIFGKIVIIMIVWFFATGVYQTGRILYNIALKLWHLYY